MAYAQKSNEELGQYLLDLQNEVDSNDRYYKALYAKRMETLKALKETDSVLYRTEQCVDVNRAEIASVVKELARRGAFEKFGVTV